MAPFRSLFAAGGLSTSLLSIAGGRARRLDWETSVLGAPASGSGSVAGWDAAAFALRLSVLTGEVGVVESLHGGLCGRGGRWRAAVGDPEVQRAVDGEAGDVVGGESESFLFVLVDGDAVGVDLHREAGEGAGVFHLAHAEDRDETAAASARRSG